MTDVEKLEAQRQKLAAKRKEATKALRAAKRREARKAAQMKKEAEQAEAVRIWDFCKRTDCTISTTVSGEKKSMQLADYIRWLMELESRRE